MRVTSDRQTLILAGETPPRRGGFGVEPSSEEALFGSADGAGPNDVSVSHVTVISARLEAVVTQQEYPSAQPVRDVGFSAKAATTLSARPPRFHQAFAAAARGSSANALNAYARTQDNEDPVPIIDTYA